jgi:hypothetical protein
MRIRLAAIAAVLALACLTASAGARQTVQAQSATTCSAGTGYGYGYSYLTSLHVTRTSCTTGRRVAKHHGHVSGWSCRRRRLDSSPVQYDEKVTCHSGLRQVIWTYTQNT